MNEKERKLSWELMQKANKLAPFGDPIQKCRMVPRGQINIVKHASGGSSYSGLCTCKSRWACPICSPMLAAEKAEVVSGMYWLIDAPAVMITYTVQHSKGDELDEQMSDLTRAMRYARNGERLSKYNEICLGYINNWEVTRSEVNGWHSHKHEINFLRNGFSEGDIVETVVRSYKYCIEKTGRLVNDFTVDCKRWDGGADYITKAVSASSELTQGQHKSYKNSLNIMDILSRSGDRNNPGYYGNLYLEYLRATKRRKMTNISRSLDRFRKKSEEIAKEKSKEMTAEDKIVATIEPDDWKKICKAGIRYEILLTLGG